MKTALQLAMALCLASDVKLLALDLGDADQSLQALYMLLDKLPKCPWCGHTGPVSSHGDHWDGCALTDAWLERDILAPWEIQS